MHCFHIFVQVQIPEKAVTSIYLFVGKSIFPTKKFCDINYRIENVK